MMILVELCKAFLKMKMIQKLENLKHCPWETMSVKLVSMLNVEALLFRRNHMATFYYRRIENKVLKLNIPCDITKSMLEFLFLLYPLKYTSANTLKIDDVTLPKNTRLLFFLGSREILVDT